MDDREATWIAEDWSGGRGLVPRGPRWLLGWSSADHDDVERHTGRRPSRGGKVWRIDVGGRFLRTGALVYPGGVPYPDELVGHTATISNEVWLYVEDARSRILGAHAWPEAIRRPIAARPEPDFPPEVLHHPDDAAAHLDFELPIPSHPSVWPALVVCRSRSDAIVFLAQGMVPDPVNEMLLFDEGGLSLRVSAADQPDYTAVLRVHQPPFRRVRMRLGDAIGREQGRPLGPQTWPWPGELMWWADGLSFELKGFAGLETLEEVARTLPRAAR